MKAFNWFIMLITTMLIQYHSYQSWLVMTGNEILSIVWSIGLDITAVYFWYKSEKVRAGVASLVVLLVAFISLSSGVTKKLDQDIKTVEQLTQNKQTVAALSEIGKGASKWGNHKSTNIATSTIVSSSEQISKGISNKKGFIETVKLWAETVLQAVGLIVAMLGQIYSIREVRTETLKTKKGEDETEKKQEVTVIRNIVVDSEVKDFAVKLYKQIQDYMKTNGISSGNKMMELLGENQGVATRLKQTKETGKGITLDKLQELKSKLEKLPLA